jgi:hypothetical protein
VLRADWAQISAGVRSRARDADAASATAVIVPPPDAGGAMPMFEMKLRPAE